MRGLVLWGAMALAGLGVFGLLAPKTRFVFRPQAETPWRAVGAAVVGALDRYLSAPIRQAADAIGWPSSRVLILTGFFAGCFTLIAALIAWWLALLVVVPALLISWRIAGRMVLNQYRIWQKKMVAELPELLAILRVHLDLGRTVPDALGAVLAGVRDPLRRDLERTLSDMALGPVQGSGDPARPVDARRALTTLARRVDRLEFRTFTDTLVQAWGARLNGEALAPLQDLLRSTRKRAAHEATGRLDMVMSAAPGLAVFGIVVWLMGGFLLHSLAGSAGLF